MSSRLETCMQVCHRGQISEICFKNPVLTASGTFNFGREFSQFYDLEGLGGLCTKGLTAVPRPGNPGIRIWETSAGMMNSIGLENPGVDVFIRDEWPRLSKLNTVTVINVGGKDEAEYLEAVNKLNPLWDDLDDIGRKKVLIELNISCPNVKCGGMAYGILPEMAADITEKTVRLSKFPVMVKLSPNVRDITAIAAACEEAGASALSLINTLQGMAVDVKRRAIVFDNLYAGLSGPAVKPIALRMTHQVCRKVKIPVMAMGGISNWQDALEFIMVGAICVQVGTMNLVDPRTAVEIIDGLEAYCKAEGLQNINEVRGILL